MPQARILAVGETATFDLNKIRDEQIPDKDGNTLPKTAKMGQVHWSVLRGGDTVRLIGRGEMTSASRQVSSSYSCPVCCPDSFAELVASPNSPVILQSGFLAVYVDGIWQDCYNNSVGPFGYPYAVSWWCEDPSIVSFTTSGSHYNANGLLAGFTLTEASTQDFYYYDDGMDCYSNYLTYTDPDDATVVAFTPHHLKILTDTNSFPYCSGGTIERKIVYQLVDVNSNPFPTQCLGCLNKKEKFTFTVNNTCGNGNPIPSGCGPTSGTDGRFTDTLTVTTCSGSANCGFSMTQEIQWCPPTGDPITVGKSETTVHKDEIIVAGNSTNSSTNLAGKFLYADGTVKNN